MHSAITDTARFWLLQKNTHTSANRSFWRPRRSLGGIVWSLMAGIRASNMLCG